MLKPTAGDTLRHARWRKQYSIRELSKVAGVAAETIIALEKNRGISETRGDRVYALAAVLDVDPDELFDRETA